MHSAVANIASRPMRCFPCSVSTLLNTTALSLFVPRAMRAHCAKKDDMSQDQFYNSDDESYYLHGSDVSDDEYYSPEEKMQRKTGALFLGALLMDDDNPLKRVVLPAAERLFRRSMADKCQHCQNAAPDHYYSCPLAQKCASCGARTDLGATVQHYQNCKRNEAQPKVAVAAAARARVKTPQKKVPIKVPEKTAPEKPELSSFYDFPPLSKERQRQKQHRRG